jgi:hypothetical protein
MRAADGSGRAGRRVEAGRPLGAGRRWLAMGRTVVSVWPPQGRGQLGGQRSRVGGRPSTSGVGSGGGRDVGSGGGGAFKVLSTATVGRAGSFRAAVQNMYLSVGSVYSSINRRIYYINVGFGIEKYSTVIFLGIEKNRAT